VIAGAIYRTSIGGHWCILISSWYNTVGRYSYYNIVMYRNVVILLHGRITHDLTITYRCIRKPKAQTEFLHEIGFQFFHTLLL